MSDKKFVDGERIRELARGVVLTEYEDTSWHGCLDGVFASAIVQTKSGAAYFDNPKDADLFARVKAAGLK